MSPVPWQSPEAIANAFVKEAFEKNLYFTKHEKWNASVKEMRVSTKQTISNFSHCISHFDGQPVTLVSPISCTPLIKKMGRSLGVSV